MNIKFKYECIDKHTKERYEQGQVKEFDEKRGLEIIKTGYAEEIEVLEEDTIKLSEMTKKELVELAKENGVSHTGTKEDIIKRLLELA